MKSPSEHCTSTSDPPSLGGKKESTKYTLTRAGITVYVFLGQTYHLQWGAAQADHEG